jgi:DNA-binding MarR family transcriptional regulator
VRLPAKPTPTQLAVLHELDNNRGRMTSRALYAKLRTRLAQSSLYTQVCWAKKRGWIDSSRSKTDKRGHVYVLTLLGRAALSESTESKGTTEAPPTWKMRQRDALTSIMALASTAIDRAAEAERAMWGRVRNLAMRGLGVVP